MAKLLSARETAVLKALAAADASGAEIEALAKIVGLLGLEATPAGVRVTLGSLRRKHLAYAIAGNQCLRFRITGIGRLALIGDRSGRWVARQ